MKDDPGALALFAFERDWHSVAVRHFREAQALREAAAVPVPPAQHATFQHLREALS